MSETDICRPDPSEVLRQRTFNALSRALNRKNVTADVLQSLSDDDLSMLGNIGQLTIKQVREYYPFDPELQRLRARWIREFDVLDVETIMPGDVGVEMIRCVTWALNRYTRSLRLYGFDEPFVNQFVKEFHKALIGHWLPRTTEDTQ